MKGRKPGIIIICLIIFRATNFVNAQVENIFDFDHSLKYAYYLYNTHQYKLAAEEFERVSFMAPEDSIPKLFVVSSWRKAGEFSKCESRIKDFYPDIQIAPRYFGNEYSKSLIQRKAFAQARSFVSDSASIPEYDRMFYLTHLDLAERKWKAARASLDAYSKVVPKGDERFVTYESIVANAEKIKYKSPGLAVAMSAFIPGTGKMYTKQWSDGIFSLLTIAATGYQAYRIFHKSGTDDAFGWVMGGLCLSFYGANLYGSARSAKRYNHRLDHGIEKQLEDALQRHF